MPEFDPYDPATMERGPEAYAALARRTPVDHYDGRFDFYIVSDPRYVRDVMFRDSAVWTSEQGVVPTEEPAGRPSRMMRDDEGHLKIRRVIQRGFSPAELRRLAGVIDEILDELLDAMAAIPEREGDLFQLLAMPLPARLMCRMLGAPEQDYLLYKAWADQYFFAINNDESRSTDQIVSDRVAVTTALFGLIDERRQMLADRGLQPDVSLIGTHLPNDFLSRFMCEQIDGEYLGNIEIMGLMSAVILGGNETTMNLIGNLVWRLLEDRSRWEALKDDPSLIEVAIEESLRLDPPVLGMLRSARHDVELGGVSIPGGAKTLYNVSAVNRDLDQWEAPDEFRLDRPLNKLKQHASFCGGPRLCLGAPLARMEVRTVMERLIERFPNLSLAGTPALCPGFNVWGKTSLPVRWG